MECATCFFHWSCVCVFMNYLFFFPMSLVLLNHELVCPQNLLQISSSYFVLGFLFLGSQKWIFTPWFRSRNCSSTATVTHLLPDKAGVGLLAPSFCCLLFVLCFGDLLRVDGTSLLVCLLLGWHPQLGVNGTASHPAAEVHFWRYGLLLGEEHLGVAQRIAS